VPIEEEEEDETPCFAVEFARMQLERKKLGAKIKC
jgi:hypothetical protein